MVSLFPKKFFIVDERLTLADLGKEKKRLLEDLQH